MTGLISRIRITKTLAITAILIALAHSSVLAQMPPDSTWYGPAQQSPAAISENDFSGNVLSQNDISQNDLSENDLANLVAPIALYPDALLSQVLVACTYPLEVVEAQQWLQRNPSLRDRERMLAAQQQNWDPSVQALVAFPDVVALLNRNIQWTTDLGNAFLGQQSDVMSAIQTMRAEARERGQLESTPQWSVNSEAQGGQSAIEIQPANPQLMYVPYYNPSAVWGAPAEGSYPSLPYTGSGFGSLFGTIANLAGLLPGFGGLLGPKSWGWALSWLAQTLFVNNSFFSDFGFHNSGGSFSGSSLWVHDSRHRLGVPYGNSSVAGQYGRGLGPARGGWRSFGASRRFSARDSFPRDNRMERAGNWRSFDRSDRTSSAGFSRREFSQPSRTMERGFRQDYNARRDPYSANSVNSRRQFADSRSFASNRNGFETRGSAREPERSRTSSSNSGSSNSWERTPRFSPARISSRDSYRGSSSRHAPKPKRVSAPKFKAPHSSRSHGGGGHSSHGHSGKKSHR
jgi:hypothetical protein